MENKYGKYRKKKHENTEHTDNAENTYIIRKNIIFCINILDFRILAGVMTMAVHVLILMNMCPN